LTLKQLEFSCAHKIPDVFLTSSPNIYCVILILQLDFGMENSLLMASNIQRFAQAKEKKKLGLPAMTIRNLEVFQTTSNDPSVYANRSGSLFYHLNFTLTKFGCRQLKCWISAPLTHAKDIEQRLDVVQYFVENSLEYENYRELLRPLPDLELLLMACINRKIRTSDFARMCTVMDVMKTNIVKVAESNSNTKPKLLQKIIDGICNNFKSASNILTYLDIDAAKNNQKECVFKKWGEFPKVCEHLKEIEQLELGLDNHKKSICKYLGWTHFEYSVVGGSEYLIEVKIKDCNLVPSNWSAISSTKQGIYQTSGYCCDKV
jgi:DNA mismatch repair ATPase MutS